MNSQPDINIKQEDELQIFDVIVSELNEDQQSVLETVKQEPELHIVDVIENNDESLGSENCHKEANNSKKGHPRRSNVKVFYQSGELRIVILIHCLRIHSLNLLQETIFIVIFAASSLI